MAIVGVDRVVFGVESMKKAQQFYTDFGLKKIKSSPKHSIYEASNKSRVEIFPRTANHLPPAIEKGSTIRILVWGVDTRDNLKALKADLARDHEITEDKDGTFYVTDPVGLCLGFRVSRRINVKPVIIPMNGPENVHRVDERAIYYDRAKPVGIGHIVFNVPDLKAMEIFYRKRLGFHLTDRYTGRGVFLRSAIRAGHHQVFFLHDDAPGLNHLAFSVRDVSEMIGGGQHMQKNGWETAVGPGRHIVSSCYFWYVQSPVGAPNEYFCDEDFCTENWKPKSYDPHPDTFAEWFLTGLPKGKRLPPTRTKKDVEDAKGRVSRVKAARKQSEVRG